MIFWKNILKGSSSYTKEKLIKLVIGMKGYSKNS